MQSSPTDILNVVLKLPDDEISKMENHSVKRMRHQRDID